MTRTRLKKQLVCFGVLLTCLGGYLVNTRTTVSADPGWIQILTPSGGTWYSAETMTITWTSQNAGTLVDIQLYNGGFLSMTIASHVQNIESNGSYNWLIPTGVPTSSICRIKVVSSSNSSLSDFSSYFSLNNRDVALRGIGPGVVGYGGEKHRMFWSSHNILGSVRLSLYDGMTKIIDIAQNIPNSQGNYLWEVPTTISTKNTYRIHIEAQTYPNVSDFSDYFTIKKRSITITGPTKDSRWYLGGIYQITWDSVDSGETVDIKLYEKKPYEMQFYFSQTIILETDNDGRQTWTVPSSLPPDSSYRVYIVSTSYTNIFNYSQTFQLTERYIQITSPRSDTDWYIGEIYSITWTSQNAGNLVNIVLYQNSVQKTILAENVTNNGLYNWSIPLSMTAADTSQLKIQSSTLPSVYGISESFSVSVKSIDISSPSQTDVWYKGDQHLITWDTKGFSSNVRIDLVSQSTSVLMITSNAANSGRYEWNIPSELSPGSMYQIKITSVSDENIYGFSNGYFTIESTLAQQWTGTIILFAVVAIGFAVAFLLIIRKWRKKIASEEEDQESGIILNVPEQLTDEEYENIWEKNRD